MSGVDGKSPLFLAVNNNNHHHNSIGNSTTTTSLACYSPLPPAAPSAKTKLLSMDVEEGSCCGGGKSAPARLVAKDGSCLIRPIHMPNHYFTLYRNWFHLLIENSWRAILLVFASGFVLSWLFFGLLYYLIALWSRADNLQNSRAEHHQCIANVQSFVSAFLFSMESQHTIGYGTRYMTEMCPQAFAVLCFQLIVGVLLQTLLAGIVIAKVLRPKKRKQEMRFSKRAVVGWTVMDEGQGGVQEAPNHPILMIRLADIQHRLYLAESHVKLYMASTKINNRGEKELIGVKDMNVGYDNGTDRVLLLWPVIIRHIIDEDSPFYGMTPDKASTATDFELIMTVEGIVEATGMTFQARTSYLPGEINWGQRFVPMVVANDKSREYEVDYGVFDTTEPCELHPDYYMHPSLEVGYPSHNKPFTKTTINESGEDEDGVGRGGDVNHLEGESEMVTQLDNRPLLIHSTANANGGSAHHLHHHRAGSGFA